MENGKKFKLTPEASRQLVREVYAIPSEPVGNHLREEDYVAYVLEDLEGEELQRVDAHIASCEECCSKMEETIHAFDAWVEHLKEQHEAKKRVAEVRPSVIDWLRRVLTQQFAVARTSTSSRTIEDFKTPDGLFHFRLDWWGDTITIGISTPFVYFEGWKVPFTIGNNHYEVDLRRSGEDQCFAELRIPVSTIRSEDLASIDFQISPNGVNSPNENAEPVDEH